MSGPVTSCSDIGRDADCPTISRSVFSSIIVFWSDKDIEYVYLYEQLRVCKSNLSLFFLLEFVPSFPGLNQRQNPCSATIRDAGCSTISRHVIVMDRQSINCVDGCPAASRSITGT